jgi:hypothetical protein
MEQPISIKDKIIDMLSRLPPDIDYDRAIESIYLLRRTETGPHESEGKEGTNHEEFVREHLAEDEQAPRHLDAAG